MKVDKMTMVRKTVTVTDQQDAWIKSLLQTGYYGNDSEIIREALREKQMRMARDEALRAKLIQGEKSIEEGGYVGKTPQEMLEGFKKQARANGDL